MAETPVEKIMPQSRNATSMIVVIIDNTAEIDTIEEPITFTSLEALYDAFQVDMERVLE